MVHGTEQETENAARELKSCYLAEGPLPKLIAKGAALESLLMQWKLCSFLRRGMIGGRIEDMNVKKSFEGKERRRTNFDEQILRKQQSICRVRWSSSVTCQQAKNKVEC